MFILGESRWLPSYSVRMTLLFSECYLIRVAGFKSEVLLIGVVPGANDVVLLSLDEKVANEPKVSLEVNVYFPY